MECKKTGKGKVINKCSGKNKQTTTQIYVTVVQIIVTDSCSSGRWVGGGDKGYLANKNKL